MLQLLYLVEYTFYFHKFKVILYCMYSRHAHVQKFDTTIILNEHSEIAMNKIRPTIITSELQATVLYTTGKMLRFLKHVQLAGGKAFFKKLL